MVATFDAVEELAARLEECRPRQEEIWELFARDFNMKAELVTYLIDLGFSLTADQIAEMEQGATGIPAAALSGTQQAILSQAEPLARELGFLAQWNDQSLLDSTLRYDARGHVEFVWHRPHGEAGLGLNWLPYSQCKPGTKASFADAQQAWSARREWLVGHHYAEYRQLADCCRLVFEVGMSLSPDQMTRVVEPAGVPVAALHPEQRAAHGCRPVVSAAPAGQGGRLLRAV